MRGENRGEGEGYCTSKNFKALVVCGIGPGLHDWAYATRYDFWKARQRWTYQLYGVGEPPCECLRRSQVLSATNYGVFKVITVHPYRRPLLLRVRVSVQRDLQHLCTRVALGCRDKSVLKWRMKPNDWGCGEGGRDLCPLEARGHVRRQEGSACGRIYKDVVFIFLRTLPGFRPQQRDVMRCHVHTHVLAAVQHRVPLQSSRVSRLCLRLPDHTFRCCWVHPGPAMQSYVYMLEIYQIISYVVCFLRAELAQAHASCETMVYQAEKPTAASQGHRVVNLLRDSEIMRLGAETGETSRTRPIVAL